jgi:hypothetical protein
MGMTDDAYLYLKEYAQPKEVCNCCKRPFARVLKVIGHYEGVFNTEHDLYEHPLRNGWSAREYMQADPWSSGPCFFIGLRVYDDENRLQRTFEWTVRY